MLVFFPFLSSENLRPGLPYIYIYQIWQFFLVSYLADRRPS